MPTYFSAGEYADGNMHQKYTIDGEDYYIYGSTGDAVKFRRIKKENNYKDELERYVDSAYKPRGVHKMMLSFGKVSQDVLDQYGGKKMRKVSKKSKKKLNKKKKPTKKNNKKRTRKH
jgi:hypothetical protein